MITFIVGAIFGFIIGLVVPVPPKAQELLDKVLSKFKK